MKKGTKVKMSERYKALLRRRGCNNHLKEFGECVGIVCGPMFPNDQASRAVDVRWQPSNLRYGYNPRDLVIV